MNENEIFEKTNKELRAASVDTGSDDYGLVIKERNDRRSAQSLYEAEVEEMNKS
jgi:hypothetical protein